MSPTAAPRPCNVTGCPNDATIRGRCAQHARAANLERGSAAARGYDARHERWRLQVLAKDKHLCRICLERHHRITPNKVADHVVPLVEWERDPRAAAQRLLDYLQARLSAHDPAHSTATVEQLLFAAGQPFFILAPWSLDNGQALCIPCHNAKTREENPR